MQKLPVKAKPVQKVVKQVEKAVEKKVKKKVNTGIGTMLGGLAGSALGAPKLGAMLGNAAESLISHIFGSGDYVEVPFDVNNNTITGDVNLITQQTPTFSGGGLSTRIVNKEFIASIGMTDSFVTQSEYILPGNPFFFPWLSGFANQFSKYKFRGLVFEFRSTAANAISGTNAGMGQIFLCTLYDPIQLVPTNLAQLLNFYFATSCKPSESMIHPVECDPTSIPINPLWTANYDSGFTVDFHNYVMATLVFGAQGPVTYGGAGQLWVSYDIELFEPKINIPTELAVKIDEKKESALVRYAAADHLMSARASSSNVETHFETVQAPGPRMNPRQSLQR